MLLLACSLENDLNAPEDTAKPLTDSDHDGSPDVDDCGRDDPFVHPGADETCNGIDDDCDGDVDEGDWDHDGDGFTDALACPGSGTDCDDDDDDVHPAAEEPCDGVDNDCSGTPDDGDADGDGARICDDCDDDDPFLSPDAAEACDGVDNDCDGRVDEVWPDDDGDGVAACAGDCDDEHVYTWPGAPESCDGTDESCDGVIDEGFDADGDGVTTCGGDCDDTDPTVLPGVPERCDGVDTDCDPATLEDVDGDGDGVSVCAGDCDDADPSSRPGAEEACDERDQDCDGLVDDAPDCWGCTDTDDLRFCTTATSAINAAALCSAFGGALADLPDETSNDAAAALTGIAAWIGLTDVAVEGSYLWPDGSALGWDAWAAGEPDGDDAEDCVVISTGGHRGEWGDEACDDEFRFICRI